MLGVIIVLLIVLWILGYVNIPSVKIPNFELFTINKHQIDLYDLLVFILISWAIGILPSPFRQIASAGLILWVLALIGIVNISGLSTIIFIAIVVGLIAYLFGHKK